MRDALLDALGMLVCVAACAVAGYLFEPEPLEPEVAHPVAYQACLERGECR